MNNLVLFQFSPEHFRDIRLAVIAIVIFLSAFFLQRFLEHHSKLSIHRFSLYGVFIFLLSLIFSHYLLMDKLHGAAFSFNHLQIYTVGRLMPLNDAQGYFNFSQMLDLESKVTEFPLFTRSLASIFNALFLRFLNHNLYDFYIWINAFSALSIFCAAWALLRKRNLVMVTALVFFLCLINSSYAGIFTSEISGFAFGNFAFACLILGVSRKRLSFALLSIALFGISAAFRPGAIFVAPLILGFLALKLYASRIKQASIILAGLMLYIFCFGINSFQDKVIADNIDAPQGNFGYILYGLAHGGKSWLKFWEDFPETQGAGKLGYGKKAYEEAFKQMKAEPHLFVKGLFKHWKGFPKEFFRSTASSVNLHSKQALSIVYFLCLLSMLLSFISKRSINFELFIFIYLLLIWLSYPFIKIPDAWANYRILAGSSFVFAFLLAYPFNYLRSEPDSKVNTASIVRKIDLIVVVISLASLLTLLIAPYVFKSYKRVPLTFEKAWHDFPRMNCSAIKRIPISSGSIVSTSTRLAESELDYVIPYASFVQNSETHQWRRDSVHIERNNALLFATSLNDGYNIVVELTEEQQTQLEYGIAEICLCDLMSQQYPKITMGEIIETIPWDDVKYSWR